MNLATEMEVVSWVGGGGVIMEKDETKDTLRKKGGDLCVDGVAGKRGSRWPIKLHTTFRLFKSREAVLLTIESKRR
jgi:hypothetical protein